MALKLFDAINDKKQVGTTNAAAKRKNIAGARAPTLGLYTQRITTILNISLDSNFNPA